MCWFTFYGESWKKYKFITIFRYSESLSSFGWVIIEFILILNLFRKHVVFGQVVGGMNVVRKIGKVVTDVNDKPRLPITIFSCGEEFDQRKHLRVIYS